MRPHARAGWFLEIHTLFLDFLIEIVDIQRLIWRYVSSGHGGGRVGREDGRGLEEETKGIEGDGGWCCPLLLIIA
jgi:hypothetical protein